MTEAQSPKQYDLEERTPEFSKHAVRFCKGVPKSIVDEEIGRQLVRSATSVGEILTKSQ